ncbi:MAG: hypothetical protein A3F83_04695 [Candidatus Glassbacteria bacterium RIFCSPLOWO2_12_FULL_58_11]|uniref:Uncharacterized protein n=1 Tax=Candidatus Glassbacteria bacterium RIFCSPLOWO2_12_FULL_58_11 TaxID=1817867 RepID=A0A1F5YNT2_9BACT|nr:MAG: hypothetical protein A3F83_04695 [Candidatus Glassbacteria bacterium RIFCSPLOWO2_12_FULL_58_11]
MKFKLTTILFLALLSTAGRLTAQDDLVKITVQPDNSEWDWQSYASKIAGKLAEEIDARVRQGIPKREFVVDSTAAVLEFRFRMDQNGILKNFFPLSQRNRYLLYLVQRSVRNLGSFAPLPESFPLFYFDGTLNIHCRMSPTRWYKRYYFEQPLDSLQEAPFDPVYVKLSKEPLLFYEPEVKDKAALLDEFRKRIGLSSEIQDTSSYTPLDFINRHVAVRIEYDSLSGSRSDSMLLKTRLEAALAEAGARIVENDFALEQQRAQEAAERLEEARKAALADSLAAAARRDSAAAAAAETLSAGKDSSGAEIKAPDEALKPGTAIAAGADSSGAAVSEESAKSAAAEPQKPGKEAVETGNKIAEEPARTEMPKAAAVDSLVLKARQDSLARARVEKEKEMEQEPPEIKRDLEEAFAKRAVTSYLVFSVGIARDSLPDTAFCRVRLFPSDKPKESKRKLKYRFASGKVLPDSLGRRLVARLTTPPPKPAPPPPPAPKPAAPPAAKTDSTARDTSAARATAPAGSTAAKPDSSAQDTAKTRITAPIDSAAAKAGGQAPAPAAKAATGAAIADSARVPADSLKAAPLTPSAPADSSNAARDSSAKAPVTVPPATQPAAPPKADSSAAPKDSATAAPAGGTP